MLPTFTAPYSQNNFFYPAPGGRPVSGKKRPGTASRKANMQFGMPKRSGAAPKNPSALDLDVSKMRPRIINQERERLYDDAMKQKTTYTLHGI